VPGIKGALQVHESGEDWQLVGWRLAWAGYKLKYFILQRHAKHAITDMGPHSAELGINLVNETQVHRFVGILMDDGDWRLRWSSVVFTHLQVANTKK
jgi:hypothetical protein